MKLEYYKKVSGVVRELLKNNSTIIFAFLSLFSIIVCLIIGFSQSVWFDEAYSVTLAKKSFSEIINMTSVDVHPPLYYLILHVWGSVFGWGVTALRGLSVIFMGVAVFISGIFLRKNFGLRAAYFSMPFIALSPILLRYGFEIRMYSLASLIGIAATLFLFKAFYETDNRKRRIHYLLYAILVAVGMLTLYYMALLWLAHVVWLIIATIKEKRKLIKSEWLLAYAGSIILFLPWLPIFIKQMTNGALAPISQAMTIENLIGVISFNFLYRPVWQLGAFYGLITAGLLIILGYLSFRVYETIDSKYKTKLMAIGLYIAVPIIILAIVGLFKPMYTERYLSHIAIGGLMFVGIILSIATQKHSWKIYVTILLMMLVLIIGVHRLYEVGNYNFQRLQKPEVAMISSLIYNCEDSCVILAADPYVATELGYYIKPSKVNFYSPYDSLGGGYAPLSGSKMQIFDTSTLSDKNTIYYAYYGNSELKMPDNLSLIQKTSSGSLVLEKYTSNL